MKQISTLLTLIFCTALTAQTFKVDTLQYRGDPDKYINIVILGDGYTAAQLDTFHADADTLAQYLFRTDPWKNYRDYFNIFAIRVISNQSGAKHPHTAGDCPSDVPLMNPDNFFGSTFDGYGIHRLIVPGNQAKVSKVLADNFPKYDQVLIIANTPYYGGSGGAFATFSLATSSREIMAHEIGHSFAGLADEYYAGDQYNAEKPNMTQETDPTKVKWKNWLQYKSVGIYQHCCGGQSSFWYKPHQNCKMEVLGPPYCPVCQEAIIEAVHNMTEPVVAYMPQSASVSSTDRYVTFKVTEMMKPIPNTMKLTWKLDGKVVVQNADSFILDQKTISNGSHTLVLYATDTTSLIRLTDHANIHTMEVLWGIDKSWTGVKLVSGTGKISVGVYPNPANDIIHVSIGLSHAEHVTLKLVGIDGRVVREIPSQQVEAGTYTNAIDISDLAAGIYQLVLEIGDYVHAEPVVKQ